MQLFNNISLREKIISIVLGISFVALVSGFAFVFLFRINSYKTKFIEEVGIHAELVARYSVTSLKAGNKQETARILAQLQVIPYVKDGIVFDKKQEIVAAFRMSDEEFTPSYPIEQAMCMFRNGYLHVVQSIDLEDSNYGKLYLRASTNELNRKIIFFGITLSALLVVLLVFVFFLARAVQSMVSKPILGLVNATRKIAGSYDTGVRGKKKTKDEIRILQERFKYILENASAVGGIPASEEREGIQTQGENAEDTTAEEKTYKALFENMNLGVMVLEEVDEGKDFLVKDFNKGGEKMERIHRADMIDIKVTELFPGVKSHGLLNAIRKVWETGYEMYHPRSQYREGKNEGWRESHIYRLPTGEIVIVYSDVTARKLAEDLQKQAPEKENSKPKEPEKLPKEAKIPPSRTDKAVQLEGVQKELEAVFYAVSNELGAPLEGIDKFSKSLLEDYAGNLDDKGKNYLIQIRAASHRLGQQFSDIAQLFQLSLDVLKQEKVDLSSLARQKALELKEGNPARRVEFAIQEGVAAQGDARLLAVVIENLLTNAWLYTAKRFLTKIEFGYKQDEDGPAEFYVKDNGTGFDMANSDKVFTPFLRLHADEVYPGTGMGLAIARRIIHRHGGVMRVEAEPDKGTVFYFTLSPENQNTL